LHSDSYEILVTTPVIELLLFNYFDSRTRCKGFGKHREG
jgi:hypothetical protein